MRQFRLPFKYEEEKKCSGLTGLAGLPLYFELLHSLNINNVFQKYLDKDVHVFPFARGWHPLKNSSKTPVKQFGRKPARTVVDYGERRLLQAACACVMLHPSHGGA